MTDEQNLIKRPFSPDSGAISTPAWSELTPYMPPLLVEAICSHVNRTVPWIDLVQGTLLLADISGFTAMTEKLGAAGKEGAEWLTSIINQYFQKMLEIGRSYGGGNLRFGGDALLLLFQGDGHAARAVTTAFLMQRATRQFNTFRVGPHRIHLKMTAGVHSGSFYSASAGLPDYQKVHLVMGPGTNKVATVQSLATAGELAISPETYQLIGDLCETESIKDAYKVLALRKHIKVAPSPSTLDLSQQAYNELLTYLPPMFADTMRQTGQLSPFESEHRRVNIIFINVQSENDILVEVNAKSLMAEMQSYISALLGSCQRYGGFLVQNDIYTNGFKLIVIFGAPFAHEHDTANALRLAVEIKRDLSRLHCHIHHRIGIHNGFVFAGNVGSSFRQQYTVMGDAVNLSARLMSACVPDQILVSKTVIDEAGLDFITAKLPPIKVKGKANPIEIYELKEERRSSSNKTLKTSGKIFGRDREIQLFKETCSEAESGSGRIVVISGNPGIGKSRLMHEYQSIMQSSGWTVYHSSCQSHTISKPFTPWIDLLNKLFDLNPSDLSELRSQKVLKAIRKLSHEFIESACLFNALLGLSIPQSEVVESLDDDSRKRRLFDLIANVFLKTAEISPISLIIEDLHWADHSTLDCINHVNAAVTKVPLLICLSHRPAETLSIHMPENSNLNIQLGELNPIESADLVRHAVGQADFSESIIQSILAKAKGNPLFLEEIAISIRHSGTLNYASENATKRLSRLDVPDRIQTLIMSRLDILSEVAKDVIRTAAVIGGAFELSDLIQLLDRTLDKAGLVEQLESLERQELITADDRYSPSTFRFRNSLIQDVAYGNLPFKRRRDLHFEVATRLEEKHQGRLEPIFENLVHHFSAAGNKTKIRFYAFRAADKARRVFAHKEAIDYYLTCLDSIEEKGWSGTSARSYYFELIGDCYEISGGHKEAAGSFVSSLKQWRKLLRRFELPSEIKVEEGIVLPIDTHEATLCHKIGVSHERYSQYDLSLKWLEAAARVLPSRRPMLLAQICVSKGVSLFRKGSYREAIHWGRTGLNLSRRKENPRQLAYAHDMISNSYLELGTLHEAIRHRKIALRIYDEIGDISGQAVANNNLGACYQGLGNLERALHHYQNSLKSCERLGNYVRVAIANNNVGEILLLLGKIEEALLHFQKVVATFEERGDPVAVTGLALINQSRASLFENKMKEASVNLKRGTELLNKTGSRGLIMEARLQEAELLFRIGNTSAAQKTCLKALKEIQVNGMKPLQARALRILGRLETEIGNDYFLAERYLEESITLAAQLKADYEKGLGLRSLAILYSKWNSEASKNNLRRKMVSRQAKTIFQKMGVNAELEDIPSV